MIRLSLARSFRFARRARPFAVTAMTASPVLGALGGACSSARPPVTAEGNLTNFY